MAKFRKIRLDYPNHHRIRPLSSVARLVHLFATLPNVSGILSVSPRQLSRQCGPDVDVARVEAALGELTAGPRPHVIWWPDDEIIWVVEAYDEQGTVSEKLRSHAAQHAYSFGRTVFVAFCARYPWAKALVHGKEEIKGTERERELNLTEGIGQFQDTVSSVQLTLPTQPTPLPDSLPVSEPSEAPAANVSEPAPEPERSVPEPAPPARPTRRPEPQARGPRPSPRKKMNAGLLICRALEQITGIHSPSSGPVLFATEAISAGRTNIDKVLAVYAAIAEADYESRPDDLGTIWWQANTKTTHRDWLPPDPEDAKLLEERKKSATEHERRAALDRQRKLEDDGKRHTQAMQRAGDLLEKMEIGNETQPE